MSKLFAKVAEVQAQYVKLLLQFSLISCRILWKEAAAFTVADWE